MWASAFSWRWPANERDRHTAGNKNASTFPLSGTIPALTAGAVVLPRLTRAKRGDASAAFTTAARPAAGDGLSFQHPVDPAVASATSGSGPRAQADIFHGLCLAHHNRGADLQLRDPFAKTDHRSGVAEEERRLRRVKIRHGREGFNRH